MQLRFYPPSEARFRQGRMKRLHVFLVGTSEATELAAGVLEIPIFGMSAQLDAPERQRVFVFKRIRHLAGGKNGNPLFLARQSLDLVTSCRFLAVLQPRNGARGYQELPRRCMQTIRRRIDPDMANGKNHTVLSLCSRQAPGNRIHIRPAGTAATPTPRMRTAYTGTT